MNFREQWSVPMCEWNIVSWKYLEGGAKNIEEEHEVLWVSMLFEVSTVVPISCAAYQTKIRAGKLIPTLVPIYNTV